MLLFGFGPGKANDLGEVVAVNCPFCHNNVFLHHVQTKKSVRLYFVPVVPYGTDDYLLCPICTRGLQLQGQQVPIVNQMTQSTTVYRRGRQDEAGYRARSAQFFAQMGMPNQLPTVPADQPVPQPVVHQSVARPVEAAGDSLTHQLEDLARLHSNGVLSDDEFASAKARLLGAG